MIFARRVVFDTSTLIGAMLLPHSVPRQAFEAALARCRLCGSDATLTERERVIERRKFDRYLQRAMRREFSSLIRRHTRLFAVAERDLAQVSPRCQDPRDDKFLALASICEARAIVSSDADLLSMNPFHGIRVLKPADFLFGITQPDE